METNRAGFKPEDYAAIEVLSLEESSTATVSPLLFGSNLEHTRSDVFRGISAQMLFNRKFAGKLSTFTGCPEGWKPVGEKTFLAQAEAYAHHTEACHMHRRNESASIDILHYAPDGQAGMMQGDLPIRKGRAYEFRLTARVTCPIEATVSLTDRKGSAVYASHTFSVHSATWETLCCTLIPEADDDEASLKITFTEVGHLFVGAVSLMPEDNFRGMRKDVIEALKEVGITILRWPGGNFAGEYCWQDGLLPCDERSPFESYMFLETQPHSMGYDFHELNTDDFVELCRMIGAEPFITINATWNTPEENAAWVEYCNGSADTPFGALRVANGHPDPYGVKYWSLGNEMGYGHMEGDNTSLGYTRIARKHAEAMLKTDPTLVLCSSGPYPSKEWAVNTAIALSDAAPLVSLHHYDGEMRYFDLSDIRGEYYSRIGNVEEAVLPKVRAMHEDLGEKARISFDEYNVWYAWYRASSVYDGIFMALMQHMILREAEPSGIELACRFESVNEGDMHVFTDETRLTASGQAFSALKHHIGGKLVYASRFAVVTEKEGELTCTLINASFDESKTFVLPEPCGEGILYEGKEILPNTRFEEKPVSVADGSAVLPPHSLMLLRMKRA